MPKPLELLRRIRMLLHRNRFQSAYIRGGVINSVQEIATGNPGGGTYSWSTSDFGISIGNPASNHVSVSGTSGGQQTITVTYTINRQSASVNHSVFVQVPNYFVTTSAPSVSTPSECTSAGASGVFVALMNFVADSNGTQIAVPDINLIETVANITSNNYATPSSTRSDGTFDDVPFGACFPVSGQYCQDGNTVTLAAGYQGVNYSIQLRTTVGNVLKGFG